MKTTQIYQANSRDNFNDFLEDAVAKCDFKICFDNGETLWITYLSSGKTEQTPFTYRTLKDAEEISFERLPQKVQNEVKKFVELSTAVQPEKIKKIRRGELIEDFEECSYSCIFQIDLKDGSFFQVSYEDKLTHKCCQLTEQPFDGNDEVLWKDIPLAVKSVILSH